MDKAINIISLIGWSAVLLSVGVSLFVDPLTFKNEDITFYVRLLQGVQLFQITDIILIVIGKTKGSLLGACLQIFARNLVSLVFLTPQSNHVRFAAVAIVWSIADVNRYLYYNFKESLLTGLLRYNSFIVLYPLGVYC
jgi:hypothetical protein